MSTFEASILRVMKGDSVVGAAFLVSEHLVATCAHVVKKAGAEVGGEISLRLSDGTNIGAIVESELWPNVDDVDAEDISILTLKKPIENIEPIKFGSSSETKGHNFSTFGFPNKGQELSGSGEIIGQATIDKKSFLQLRSPEVTPGFSGAPVFDDDTGRVVGMVVSITPPNKYQRLGTTAFAIPAETIHKFYEELKLHLPEEIEVYMEAVSRSCREIPSVGTKSIFLDEIYVKQNVSHAVNGSITADTEIVPINDAILKFQKIIIIGNAGMGKSTLLRHITSQIAEKRFYEKSILPILISAKGLAERKTSFERALREQIEVELEKRLPYELPNGFLNDWQRKAGGRWLISLDGVDEIRDPYQKKEFISNLSEYPWPPNSTVVITSRPDPSITFPDIYQKIELVPFRKKQTEEFIDLWFRDNLEKRVKLKQVLNANLNILGDNPLLLTLVAQIFDRQDSLPNDQIDLYDYFINLLLDIRNPSEVDISGENWALRQVHQQLTQEFVGIGEKIFADRRILIERIALGFYNSQDIYKTVRDTFSLSTISEAQRVLQIFSSQRIGLLAKRGTYEFVHNSFRDFLAAQNLVTVFNYNIDKIWKWLLDKWDDNVKYVAVFALAILNKRRTNVQHVLDEKVNTPEGLLFLSEYLAITGDKTKFGKKVISLLYKNVRVATRVDFLLGQSSIEGLRKLSYHPDTTEALKKLISDKRVDRLAQQESLRILSNILTADEIGKYILIDNTVVAREAVRILFEASAYDDLVKLARSVFLDFIVITEIFDTFIKLDKWEHLINSIPEENNDILVGYISDELIENNKSIFFEQFILWILRSSELNSDKIENALTKLFLAYLKKSASTEKSDFVISLLGNTQNTPVCAKLFSLFMENGDLPSIAKVCIYLIYDANFSHLKIRHKIADKLAMVQLLEEASRGRLINDFLNYFQELSLDAEYLAVVNSYDLANLLLSKDTGFSLEMRETIRSSLIQKKYWPQFMPVLQINQSGKFEQTSDDTILLCCTIENDGPFYSVLIPAEVKKSAISFLRNRGNSKIKSLLKGFAATLALLIHKCNAVPLEFYIDKEYLKHSEQIKVYLFNYLSENHKIRKDTIKFSPLRVYSTRSHELALETRKGKYSVNSVISEKELLDIIKKPAHQKIGEQAGA